MKIIVFGADGMLGSDLVKTLCKNHSITASLEKDADIIDENAVDHVIGAIKPQWVINAAGYTDVDGCETNTGRAFTVNAMGPKNIALACKKVSAKLLHFSTDYVFDGKKASAYTEEDRPGPINVYGESKLKGEEYIRSTLTEHIIVRTQWLYGKNGRNFVDTMLRSFAQKKEIDVVKDQHGSLTYTLELATAIEKFFENEAEYGIYNVTNSGEGSWYEVACEIASIKKADIALSPIPSEKFNRPASRPKNSRMSCRKFYDFSEYKLPDWKESLRKYLAC